ncbi:DUF4150 domain-containing protein [Mesorhizobium sp. BR1-1-13]|uniref:PAAR-like domain-containing protein n=1 Tax=Mesorhizobium sp. BR1-1-13 TaxID=2876656 RepID=UPI001CD09497|nr:PAAR-like domain-containing protein [Mesorhizobium sp. BR1-1-13]MBZ9942461.1 DUF4150 domain-containing protein [Mesorhizobium sp. BR1-1-13]
MGNNVYAESMGFFHKGSSGQGVAPGDVCLSPPSPPAGPVPVPYVNMLSAGDLAKGSKSVKIQGNPTAMENASEVSTSKGNEPATQGLGAGVVTHKIQGKGVFKLWSFVVKVEGKGADRHGDMMAQNTASDLPNCIDAQAMVNFKKTLSLTSLEKECDPHYDGKKHRQATTENQRDSVNKKDSKCWECVRDLKTAVPPLKAQIQKKLDDYAATGKPRHRADHQPPENVCWEMGGCHLDPSPQAFKDAMKDEKMTVVPHCPEHSSSQGGKMSHLPHEDVVANMKAATSAAI